MKKENSGSGYLNFELIQNRLKTKKYGPGKNMIKEDIIQYHIRNVFQIGQKYFSHDPLLMKIIKVLEAYFEKEILSIH